MRRFVLVRKMLSVLLISLLLIGSVFPAFAQEEERMIDPVGGQFSFMPDVDGEPVNMIENDYYKLYANDIFAHEYATLSGINPEYFQSELLGALTEGTYAYFSLIFTEADAAADYAAYNTEILHRHFSDDEILYVADSVPMAVVRLSADKVSDVYTDKSVAWILNAFFGTNPIVDAITGSIQMGDVLAADGKVTASDARQLLRMTAGLEEIPRSKTIWFGCDMNFDGHLTPADARIILRTAAGLEKEVSISFNYAATWDDFR